jgi:hypothetical protein
MVALAGVYTYEVEEITGGVHETDSRHYAGVAMDVVSINGVPVSKDNKDVVPFMKMCRALGATKVGGPGVKGHERHIHAAWPRPKS